MGEMMTSGEQHKGEAGKGSKSRWRIANEAFASYGLIPIVLLLAGGIYNYGYLRSGLEDLKYVRTTVDNLAKKVDGIHTSTELIKAKIDNEIIPRLNNDPKIKPLAGIPIQKQINVGGTSYSWAVPYKAKGGESVVHILTAADIPWDQAKINEVVTVNPNSLKLSKYVAAAPIFLAVRGADILIPVSDSYVKKYLGETGKFRENLLIHKEPAPPKEKESGN